MQGFLLPAVLAIYYATGPGTNVTPVDAATNDVITYVLGFGPLGIVALAFAFRFIVPGKALDKARDEARADLVQENGRLLERAEKAERQRDEALASITDKVVPLLAAFTQTTSALLPLLQTLVARREDDRGERR